MDNKKRMMFVLDEDYYFITIKLLIILKGLNCYKSNFVDHRKLAFIIGFIKEDKNIDLYRKSICISGELTLFDRERLISMYCSGNIDQPIVKKVLFFLEEKGLIHLEKNIKFNCINVRLVKNKELEEVLSSENYQDDMKNVKEIHSGFTRVRSIKYESFIEKVFGDSEVAKWES